MNPVELFGVDGKPLSLWMCGECRKVESSQPVVGVCCKNPVCKDCGKPARLHLNPTLCDECERKRWMEAARLRREKELAAAVETAYEGGMVYCEGLGGQDGWHNNMAEFVDWMDDNHYDDETGEELPRPEWVFAASSEVMGIDVWRAIDDHLEHVCEDGYEDMWIKIDDEFQAAIDAFNQRHKEEFTVWHVDQSRKYKVPSIVRTTAEVTDQAT